MFTLFVFYWIRKLNLTFCFQLSSAEKEQRRSWSFSALSKQSTKSQDSLPFSFTPFTLTLYHVAQRLHLSLLFSAFPVYVLQTSYHHNFFSVRNPSSYILCELNGTGREGECKHRLRGGIRLFEAT